MPAVLYRATHGIGAIAAMGYVNPQVETLLGYPPAVFFAEPDLWGRLVLAEDRHRLYRVDEIPGPDPVIMRTEYRMRRADGRVVWVRDDAVVSAGPQSGTAVREGVVTDITTERALGDQLRHAANHDALTGLPNRVYLTDLLEAALGTGRPDDQLSLLFMDLDDFKNVNDTLGHAFGDELLVAAAARIAKVIRGTDVVARLGGDEFAVVLPATGEIEAVAVAERINTVLRVPFVLEGRRVLIGASIGVAAFPIHGASSVGEMMRLADLAMYAAKRSHTGVAVYDATLDDPLVRAGLMRLEELRVAVEQDQFVLHYQPVVDLRDGQVRTVEALVRWDHPTAGLLSPGEFLPLAEHIGLIRALDRLVLEHACHQAAAWRDQGRTLCVAVNISRVSLLDETFSSELAAALIRHRLEGPEIEIEITENGMIGDPRAAAFFAERLAGLGVRLAIDDFGTGYSSLAQLRQLRVSTLKIDKSFVDGVATDAEDVAIVETVIQLGHRFGQDVVAEGIENERQLDVLRTMGADHGQGYFISHPLPVSQIDAWLDHKTSPGTST